MELYFVTVSGAIAFICILFHLNCITGFYCIHFFYCEFQQYFTYLFDLPRGKYNKLPGNMLKSCTTAERILFCRNDILKRNCHTYCTLGIIKLGQAICFK